MIIINYKSITILYHICQCGGVVERTGLENRHTLITYPRIVPERWRHRGCCHPLIFDITVTVIFIVVSWIGHIFDLLKIRYYHLLHLLLDLDVVGVSILYIMPRRQAVKTKDFDSFIGGSIPPGAANKRNIPYTG